MDYEHYKCPRCQGEMWPFQPDLLRDHHECRNCGSRWSGDEVVLWYSEHPVQGPSQ